MNDGLENGFEGFTQVLLFFEMVLVFDHVGFGFGNTIGVFGMFILV